ncbi:hypothetical protein FFL01_15150 [Flavobacterium flevense]|uniref:Uncharacterized protein n=2 Tax=Flavobacterium flevense TaxID=983 RepID=A0A4Y4AUU5_9FLAO|nr:hypothetical protein FFL01_15150 [Flavobacterium flevense]
MQLINIISSGYEYFKNLPWEAIILFLLFFSAIGQFFISKADGKTKEELRTNTVELIKTGEETINNLNELSDRAKIDQKAANKAYKKLEKTYGNTIIGLENDNENYQAIIDNLKTTLKAKNEILKSQTEMISRLTGGNSYPYIKIEDNKLQIYLEGEYGIPYLNVEISFVKNYLNLSKEEIAKYYATLKLNPTNITLFYNHLFRKLYVNKYYQEIEIPDDILKSLIEDDCSGFDIKFESDYKSWTQRIRLVKNKKDKNRYEVFNVLYESKDKKVKYSEEMAKTLILEATPNFKDFFNDEIKQSKGFEKLNLGYVVIFYPFIDVVEFKESEIDQTAQYFVVNQFKYKY